MLLLVISVSLAALITAESDGVAAMPRFFAVVPDDIRLGVCGKTDKTLETLLSLDIDDNLTALLGYDLRYPPSNINSDKTIKCIEVIDKVRNGFNAKPNLVSGGIDQKSVNIKFSSILGSPIHYAVLIKGKKQ